MARCAFKLRIKPEAIEDYEREHQRVWPELLAKLKEVGISDYSIFRRDQELFLCMRVDDFDRAMGWLRRLSARDNVRLALMPLFEPVDIMAAVGR